ncbi:YtpI family protein [Ureibacillus sp. Re31]|uniref:YtpI family protein n=1 Tax=Ureibacillus galli TaxID=2762222 RepID=A0ABR8XA83_9BACL|nr:YtpI family protein [Ureibacillus galli]MBD8026235.1 YtpI family protein [Ureibacillus galli]
MLNYIFVFFIVVSFVAYFYYKTRQFRSTLPIRKKWYKAKAGVALGIFIMVFGLNTCIIYPTLVGFIIAAVFILVGFMEAFSSYKRVRHEGQFVEEEYELNK